MNTEKIGLLRKLILLNRFSDMDIKKYKKKFAQEDFAGLEEQEQLQDKVIGYFNQTGKRESGQNTKINNLAHVGGSGGDSIDTVNVSTLSAMTVASLGYKIVKSGSESYTSLVGSSDFIFFLIKNFGFPKETVRSHSIALGKYNFFYSHVADCYPWIQYIENVRLFFGEYLFSLIFNGMDRNVLNAKIKIDGINGSDTSSRLHHYQINKYQKALVMHGMSDDGLGTFGEVSNVGKTQISFFNEYEICHKSINPSDFRKGVNYKEADIRISDKAQIFLENLMILKGEGKKEFLDLIAMNSVMYIIFLNDFKIDYKETYRTVMRHLLEGKVYSHFIL